MSEINPYESPQSDINEYVDRHELRGLLWLLFSLRGRIPRRAFWGAMIGTTLAYSAICMGIALALGRERVDEMDFFFLLSYPVVLWIYLAVMAKRWHDRDKSVWWLLVCLIPVVGPLWIYVELGGLRGTFGVNRYGSDPT